MHLLKYYTQVILLFYHTILFSQEEFVNKVISPGLINNQIEIQYYKNNQMIGFISYTGIPLCKFYAIHSFFIYPKFRNKGHGKKLLSHACNFLKNLGAKKIYIQPGPFDIENNKFQNIPDQFRETKIQSLIKLYKEIGFDFVSTFTSKCTYLLYKIIGIDENPKYLMVKY